MIILVMFTFKQIGYLWDVLGPISSNFYIHDQQKTNVIYQFKRPLGDCISGSNSIYVGLTSMTLSRRLTRHFSHTSSLAQHLKKHSSQQLNFGKFIPKTTILEQQNNTQKLQTIEALHIRNIQPKLNRINFETSANIVPYSQLILCAKWIYNVLNDRT